MKGETETGARRDDRARGLLLRMISEGPFGCGRGDLVAAVCPPPDPAKWTAWKEVTGAVDDAWYFWRTPGAGDGHADQAIVTELGLIEGKHGCGASFYLECQPVQIPDDARLAIETMLERENWR